MNGSSWRLLHDINSRLAAEIGRCCWRRISMEGGANGMRREVHEGQGGDQLAASEGHMISYELRIGQLQARMSKVCMTCTCKVDGG